jgi:hypothetical protein
MEYRSSPVWKILLTAPVLAIAVISGSAPPAMAGAPGSTSASDLPVRGARAASCTPDSPQPSVEWFCWNTYTGENAKVRCFLDGLALVASHQAGGSLCGLRSDQESYDLWLKKLTMAP